MKRRSFFRMAALGAAGAALSSNRVQAKNAKLPASVKNKPLVLSTWNHGLAANEGAWKTISKNGSAVDAVMHGVMVTESDRSNRSVGIGGRPDRDGHVTLDACIMDEKSRCGAVAFVEGVEHPVYLARKVMEDTQHVMLVGKGAEQYAQELGIEKVKSPIAEVWKDYQNWLKEQKARDEKPVINHENHDTIGMIAMDAEGRLSGACTTSGWAYKMHGRVGDSPIIGAGLYVDGEVGAATATGLGEAVIRVAGSHTVVECMRHGMSPQEACEEAVKRIIAKHDDLTGLQVGFLALDTQGNIGAASVYPGFNYALRSTEEERLIDAKHFREW